MTKRGMWIGFGGAVGVAALVLTATAAASGGSGEARARRGGYLVKSFGCNDCHTPLKLGPQGPEPDMSRMLSGHPEGLQMPPAPRLGSGPWVVVVSGTNTAWSGPWGVITANLTPDLDTGLGRWTERNFIDAIRTGRHMGRGRPILPPMPAQALANLSDDDLASVFEYLRQLPSVKNRVPDPVPPAL